MDQRPRTCFKATRQKKFAPCWDNSSQLPTPQAWQRLAGLPGPLNRFWPFVCWEQRNTPNSQLSSGHGPNDRRSSSARWKRLEGLCAGSSNHGAPLPTAHLLSGAHQVTSALGWRSGANRAIAAEPRRMQPFRSLLGWSGHRARAEGSMGL
ncbi:hypothetical protein HDV63DRAFT_389201 [Trichoderma sp. SZMC 28014]